MTGGKCKGIRVLEKEGYGKNQQKIGSQIESVICRFNFPKYPLDQTEILSAIVVIFFSKSYNLSIHSEFSRMKKEHMQ